MYAVSVGGSTTNSGDVYLWDVRERAPAMRLILHGEGEAGRRLGEVVFKGLGTPVAAVVEGYYLGVWDFRSMR